LQYKAWGHAEVLSNTEREIADNLRERARAVVFKIAQAANLSPLLAEADQKDLRIAAKKISAALALREYIFWDATALANEDVLLGVHPAGQEERDIDVSGARAQFHQACAGVFKILDFIFPSEIELTRAIVSAEIPSIKRYRPNTAFILMWISREHPELEDVKNSFKEVFKEFGIDAIRSDEIEHQDVITKRILDEISTAEFLIADLTGERPSVYYEVGYAHAIGKRPILFRKKDTPLHFDLAVHNVPEYENLTDLQRKLRNRLSVLTNRRIEN
jgi:hypothetical protein